MSKVDGPLYGTEATGSIARQITFSNQWGWAITRGYSAPHDRPTPLRTYQRGRFWNAVSAWNALDTDQKALWTARKYGTLTGYNLFIHAWLTGWTAEDFPLQELFYGTFKFGEGYYGLGA